MARDSKALDIYIMGREYRLACEEAEQEALIQASQYLDLKMREIREQGKVIGIERIAVMAALNMAFEFLHKAPPTVDTHEVQRRMETMEAALDEALKAQSVLF